MSKKKVRKYEAAPTKEQARAVLHLVQRYCCVCPECGEKWSWFGPSQHGMHKVYVERGGARYQVRRVVFAAHNGVLPDGMQLSTTCDNRNCLNPELLAAVSKADVLKRLQAEKRLHHQGHRAAKTAARRLQARTKMSIELAREIRAQADVPAVEFAKRLNVSPSTVRSIRAYKTWVESNPFAGLGARS